MLLKWTSDFANTLNAALDATDPARAKELLNTVGGLVGTIIGKAASFAVPSSAPTAVFNFTVVVSAIPLSVKVSGDACWLGGRQITSADLSSQGAARNFVRECVAQSYDAPRS